jgi:hypothetical protein
MARYGLPLPLLAISNILANLDLGLIALPFTVLDPH